jgi:hypothetical protein
MSWMTGVDTISIEVYRTVEERFAEYDQQMKQAHRVLYNSPLGANLKRQAEESGVTVEDVVERELDAPFSEGHSGFRSLLAEGFRPQIEGALHKLGYDRVRDLLAQTWFQDGRFDRLTEPARGIVSDFAERRRKTTIKIYRELQGRLDVAPGDFYSLPEPESWSLTEKAVMGETTLIVERALYGTVVSILSPYIGENEVISRCPAGYEVLKVEDKTWAGRPSRRLVYLRERRKSP